jgi:hypothetical protein
MHARAAKGEKMDGSVNVHFFCQKLATVNANLQHNGQGFTFGVQIGATARTVFNKVKTVARQEMCVQMLDQPTGGGAELADNPNEWPDAKEPCHTANGALWPHARRDDDADGLFTLAVNALAYEWDAYAAAFKRRPGRRSERRNTWHPPVVTRTTVSRPAKPPGLIVWMLPMMMKVAVGMPVIPMRRRSPEQQLTVPHNPGHA